MANNPKIAVIGGGSWATAIIKMLLNNVEELNWWLRDEDNIAHIKKYGHNRNYLPSVLLNIDKLNITNDIQLCIADADIVVFAVPSAFLKKSLAPCAKDSLLGKVIFSAIKGIVPENNVIVGEFFHNQYGLSYEDIGVITGPCHAEEVAQEKLSYLTIACSNTENAAEMASKLECRYIKTKVSDDIFGTEYSAVLKNIFALANGICHGLGYGDNFQAVLVSNGIKEIERFVNAVHPIDRDIKNSAYLGDLMVTAYSKFSRNRTFGNMIGKGHSVQSAQTEMKMIAEGYYAAKCIVELNKEHKVHMPITDAVYQILYCNASAREEMKILADHMN